MPTGPLPFRSTLPCLWLPSAALQGMVPGRRALYRLQKDQTCPRDANLAPPPSPTACPQPGCPGWAGGCLPVLDWAYTAESTQAWGGGEDGGALRASCLESHLGLASPSPHPAPSSTPQPLPAALPCHSPDSGAPGAGSAWGEPTQESPQDSRACSGQTPRTHGLHHSFLGAPASGPLSPLPSPLRGQL